MAHNRRCAEAKGRACKCGGCNGLLHGWQPALALADEPTGEGRAAFRRENDEAWAKTRRTRPGATPSRPRQAAAARSATADVIDWLAVHEHARALTGDVGDVLSGPLRRKLRKELKGAEPSVRQAFARHFWCEFLAATAQAVDDFRKGAGGGLQRVPDLVTTHILSAQQAGNMPRLPRMLVRFAVLAAWSSLCSLVQIGEPTALAVKAMRLLAVLLCPAPEHHPAVQEILKVLSADVLRESTIARLTEVFEPGWETSPGSASLAG